MRERVPTRVPYTHATHVYIRVRSAQRRAETTALESFSEEISPTVKCLSTGSCPDHFHEREYNNNKNTVPYLSRLGK